MTLAVDVTEAERKKYENGSRIWVSAILKEEFSSYDELSSREIIHNIPAFFLHQSLSLTIFSSDLLESQDPR